MMTVEERTVLLYDTPCTITISHPSKTVWVAVGGYRSERIEVNGSSASNAAQNCGAKVEYLYVDLGSFNCGLNCGAGVTDNVSFHTNILRAGVNYRF